MKKGKNCLGTTKPITRGAYTLTLATKNKVECLAVQLGISSSLLVERTMRDRCKDVKVSIGADSGASPLPTSAGDD